MRGCSIIAGCAAQERLLATMRPSLTPARSRSQLVSSACLYMFV